MKLNTILLTLFIVVTTLAYHLENKLIARDEFITLEEAVECRKNVDSYKECTPSEKDSLSKEKLEELCERFNSQKCKEFYSKPIKSIEKCEKLSKSVASSQETCKNTSFEILVLTCSKDEKNNYCPLAKLNMYEESTYEELFLNHLPSDEDFKNALNETCQSKNCYEAAYSSFLFNSKDNVLFKRYYTFNNDDSYETFNKFQEFVQQARNILSSNRCRTINGSNIGKTTSGSNTIHINYFLILICLTIILSFVY